MDNRRKPTYSRDYLQQIGRFTSKFISSLTEKEKEIVEDIKRQRKDRSRREYQMNYYQEHRQKMIEKAKKRYHETKKTTAPVGRPPKKTATLVWNEDNEEN